jgi:hypothetical protein
MVNLINKSADRDVDASIDSNSCKGTISMITYLYHKRHVKTGLNYFGKTTKDPYKYTGSGVYWKRHLEKHGKEIETVQVWTFENLEECKNFAIDFSIKNNIVQSKDWANFVIENGVDGQSPGFKNTKLSEYNKAHNKDRKNQPGYIPNRLGKKDSAETLEKKRQAHLGKTYSPLSKETKQKISKSNSGPRPHTSGKNNSMYGYVWSEAQKELLKEKRKGKVWWNNGIDCTMSINCPGEGYIRGRLYCTK